MSHRNGAMSRSLWLIVVALGVLSGGRGTLYGTGTRDLP